MTTTHNMNRMLAARLAERTGLSVSIVNVGGGCPVIEARMPGTTLGVGPHVLIVKPTDIDIPLDERGRYVHGVTVLAHVDADDATPDEMLTVDGPHALHVGGPAVTEGIANVLRAWRDDHAAQAAPESVSAAVEVTATDMLTTVRVNGCELRIWEPDTEQGDRGRMYVLDALGLTLMVREREDGTFLHVDDDGETAPFRGPLMVEVRNGGEETYGEPAADENAGE